MLDFTTCNSSKSRHLQQLVVVEDGFAFTSNVHPVYFALVRLMQTGIGSSLDVRIFFDKGFGVVVGIADVQDFNC